MKWAIGFLALSVMTSTGCSLLSRPPLTTPERGGPAWREIASEHFTLQTDLDEDDALAASANLETALGALSELGFASDQKPTLKIDVVYFRRREDYEQVAPKTTFALFEWVAPATFERTSLAILHGDFVNDAREAILHELTHALVHHYYPQAPVWLNEGLAKYYQTLQSSDGTATLGRPPRSSRFWKGPWSATSSPRGWTALIPFSEAPAPTAILDWRHDGFYAAPDADPRAPEGLASLRMQAIHYAASWSLVHLLVADPTYSAAFGSYLEHLRAGETSEWAWSQTVGALPEGQLERDYFASLVARETTVLKTKYTPVAPATSRPRAMSNAEVHVLFARLRGRSNGASAESAQKDLEEAMRLDPNEPGVALLRAAWQADGGDLAGAERVLRDAVASRPDDPRLLNALGWVTIRRMSKGGNVKMAEVAAALEPITAKLAPIARTAAELDLVAHGASFNGDVDGALELERRAMAADPSCVQCLSTAAALLDEKGMTQKAYETASLALGLVPEGVSAPGIARQVAAYRSRGAAERKSKPASRPNPGSAASPKPSAP
jgi:Tfp pilus assembly protein PilF